VHSLAEAVTGRSNCRRVTKLCHMQGIDMSCVGRWRLCLKTLMSLTGLLRCSCRAVFEMVGCVGGGGAYKLAASGRQRGY
jgi:hypothetical protein